MIGEGEPLLTRLVWLACLWVAVAPIGWAKEKFVAGFIQIFPDGGCQLNQKAILCDRVPLRLRAMHLSPGISVLVAVDDAPHESVVALLDSLQKSGIHDVFILPPFLGTNPSESLKHWIKLLPEGVPNHTLSWKVMISTESFRHWGETLIVLPESDFAVVDGLATARIAQGNCAAKFQDVPMDLRRSENRLWLFEHGDGSTQSCLFPRTDTSCDFLSAVMRLSNVHWGTGDLDEIRKVVAAVGCKARN